MVKNAKAKIRRTNKNYGIDLSNEIELPSLESFQTRKQFNEFREKIGSFTNKNNQRYQFVKNEHGIVASKSLLNEIKRDTKAAQNVAKREIEKMKKNVTVEQKQEMLKMKEPMKVPIHIPVNFDFTKIRSKGRLKNIAENVKRRADPNFYNKRTKTMQETFIRELEESFNSDANWLVEQLKKMNPDDFLDMYKMYNSFDFRTYYTMRGMNENAHDIFLKRMERDFQRYQRGDDYSLKDFK